MYKKEGIHLFEDVELEDFTWELVNINFDIKNRKARLTVEAWETKFRHSRAFEFDIPESVSSMGVNDAISMLIDIEPFIGSTEI